MRGNRISFPGPGRSRAIDAVATARATCVGRLLLFHHAPWRANSADYAEAFRHAGDGLSVTAAREGDKHILHPREVWTGYS